MSATPTQMLDHSDFPALSKDEFMALARMHEAIGSTMFQSFLNLSQSDQLNTVRQFMTDERAKADALYKQALSNASFQNKSLKLHVSNYSGAESENLIRWFTELEMSINVRGLPLEEHKVAYAMSLLTGRAKNWAYGCRMQDPECFPSFDNFKRSLELAFQPPKCEFRLKSQLLDTKQGNRNLYEYIQEMRYLISGIVLNPVDQNTLVSIFMKGLKAGPVRNQLFREYPQSFEKAVALAMQEEFSRTQAIMPAPQVRKPERDPYAMDCSSIRTNNGPNARLNNDKSKMTCHRCGKLGHFARTCFVARPGSDVQVRDNGKRFSNKKQSKNVKHQ
jgi:hypothetical protein